MREEANLAQRTFATLIQRTQTFVQQSETGSRRVDFSEFVAWADACGMTPHQALDRYLALVRPGTGKGATCKYPAHATKPLTVRDSAAQEDRERKAALLLEEAAALLKKDRRKGARTQRPQAAPLDSVN